MAELEELRTQLEAAQARETAVRDVMQTMARSRFDLQTVLQEVVDRAVELCHAETGNLARQDGDVYRVAAFNGFSPQYEKLVRERVYLPERRSIIGRAILERRIVHIHDVLQDPDYDLPDIQRAGNYRSVMSTPLLRDGEPIGAIGVGRRVVRPFSDAEVRLLETFANQVVLAIENTRLFETVERQRTELARYAPQVASLLSTDEGERLLAGHRQEITVLFSDLRGFTAFSETAEPEVVFEVLRTYHTEVGRLVVRNGGTVEHFSGDGLMAFYNDPVEIAGHELAAVHTAVKMRERFAELATEWRKRGFDLGLGVGIATGYATLGRIGFEGRYDYAAIGSVVNLAARLSDAAGAGEILVNQRVHAAVEDRVVADAGRELQLKGFSRPAVALQITGLRV